MTKFIKITNFEEIQSRIDGRQYRLSYELGDMVDGEFRPAQQYRPTVSVSGTLQAVWGTTNVQTHNITGGLAANAVVDLARKGALEGVEEIKLNTYTAPHTPPIVPIIAPGIMLEIPEARAAGAVETGTMGISFLSDDISEIRDQINTLSKHIFGDRLLLLPQERALIDMYKSAETAENFRSRVQSLAGVAIAVDKELIGKLLSISDTKEMGSITLLDKLFANLSDKETARNICDVFKNINNLRQGYPVHGDNVDTVVPAHDYFGIPYPIEDYSSAWERILSKYFEGMKRIRDILNNTRSKK